MLEKQKVIEEVRQIEKKYAGIHKIAVHRMVVVRICEFGALLGVHPTTAVTSLPRLYYPNTITNKIT